MIIQFNQGSLVAAKGNCLELAQGNNLLEKHSILREISCNQAV